MRAPRPQQGPTTRGRCLIAGGLAAVACAVLLDERDLLRVGIVAAALPIVAMVLGLRRASGLTAARQVLPNLLRPSATGIVHLRLANRGRRPSSPTTVTDPAVADLSAGIRSVLPRLPPGATGTVTYRLRAARRGRFTLGSVRTTSVDPFGLWERERSIPCSTDILVVPSVVTLVALPSAAGAQSAPLGSTASGAAGGDPDVQVRQYVPGDDIRTMHWRASAKRDELMVRLRQTVAHGSVTVLLDHRACAHRGRGADSSLETAVTLAASISLHLIANDYHVSLVDHRGATLASGNDIADRVLGTLAEIEADPDCALRPAAARASGLMVAVLSDTDQASARALAAMRSRGARGIVLLLRASDWGEVDDDPAAGDWSPNAAASSAGAASSARASSSAGIASFLEAGGWRVVTVHRGDDLSDCWTRACGGSGDPMNGAPAGPAADAPDRPGWATAGNPWGTPVGPVPTNAGRASWNATDGASWRATR